MKFILPVSKDAIFEAWEKRGEVMPPTIEMEVDDTELPEAVRKLYRENVVKLVSWHEASGKLSWYKPTSLEHGSNGQGPRTPFTTYRTVPTATQVFADILDMHERHAVAIRAYDGKREASARAAIDKWLSDPDLEHKPDHLHLSILGEQHELVQAYHDKRRALAVSELERFANAAEGALSEGLFDFHLWSKTTSCRQILPDDHPAVLRVWQVKETIKAAHAQHKQTEEDQQQATCDAWIREYGSNHLRLMLAEHFDVEKLYLAERLAAERPGWVYFDSICGELDELLDPSEEHLQAFIETRKTTVPDVELSLLKDGCHLDSCEHEGEPHVDDTACLSSEFLGETIVLILGPATP